MIILGSTGSIGVNALEIAKKYHWEVETLSAGKNIALLNQQISLHKPQRIVIADKADLKKIDSNYKGKIYFGENGILEAIADSKSQLVLNALVGFLGFKPTLCAIDANKKVALANKESLVVAGEFIHREKIIPIDSEHFSLSYLMNFKANPRPFKRLCITASGGAFRDLELTQIAKQSAKEALKHPNWKMGEKITIDSATMMNKLFEILEAFWLFKSKNIDAYIERNSHIHALVEFFDGSVVAHFANANMQLPIAYALAFGLGLDEIFLSDFKESLIPSLNFCDMNYRLEKIDPLRYPLWALKEKLLENPKQGVILNASNEVAVYAFLQNKISFGDISKIVFKSLENFENPHYTSIDELIHLDKEVRIYANEFLKTLKV